MPAAAHDHEEDERHEPEPAGEDRTFTIPNAISIVRLACIPLFVYLLFGKDDPARAAYLLGALGATDWVDGFIARRFNQVSTLGKVLDPTADRLLLGTALVAILVEGAAPRAVTAAVLLRELLVAGAAITLAAVGAARIDVTWVGKAGTFCNLFAFPLFLGGSSGITWRGTANGLAWAFVIPGLVLSWYAAAGYVPLARQAIRQGRVGATT